jgi:hypothetical protein
MIDLSDVQTPTPPLPSGFNRAMPGDTGNDATVLRDNPPKFVDADPD